MIEIDEKVDELSQGVMGLFNSFFIVGQPCVKFVVKKIKNGLLLRFCSGETKHALIDGGIIIITRTICGDFTLKVAL